MNTPFVWILALIALVVVLYKTWPWIALWIYSNVSPHVISPLKPDFTIEEAWNILLKDLELKPDAELAAVGEAYKRLDGSQRRDLKEHLLTAERSAAASESPIVEIRMAIMKAETAALIALQLIGLPDADRSRIASEFGESYSDGSIWQVLATGHLTTTVLRYYARLKYDDVGEKDWFEYFREAGKALAKGRVAMVLNVARDPQDSFSELLMDQYIDLFEQLKRNVVNTPRKAQLDFSKLAEEKPEPVAG